MNSLRLLMVTPRYWPQVGEMERMFVMLAEACSEAGVEVTVLTAAWDESWPRRLAQGRTRVFRLPQAPQGGWSTYRYLRSLSRWLREHRSRFDVVHVAGLRHDAYAVLGAIRRDPMPVAIRATEDDGAWQQRARFGGRIRRRCRRADAIVTATGEAAEQLGGCGYDRERIHVIPLGCTPGPDRSRAGQLRAREALAGINHDLAVADYAPAAVCVRRLDRRGDLFTLVEAWRVVADRWPSARLWILGDGPLRVSLYERIVERSLHHTVFLPGSFDDLDEVFQAADLFVALRQDVGTSPSQLQAMASGLPLVATDSPANRRLLSDGSQALLVRDEDPAALASAISRVFEFSELAAQLAEGARRVAARQFPLERSAAAHVRLFQQLAAARQAGT